LAFLPDLKTMETDFLQDTTAEIELGNLRVLIRQLAKEDLPSLEWEGEYSHFRRLYAMAYKRAKHCRAVLWIAEANGEKIIGQLFVQLDSERRELADGKRRAYIYSFRIRPTFRGLGVGTLMLSVAEADLKKRGVEMVTLNVGRDNMSAHRLYKRQGYRIVAAEPGVWQYIDDRGRMRTVHEPAWRMEKKILWNDSNHSII
jgi:ribosomal protein S18 acetylase RimI-like enzyme